jgi:uncharacterized protein YlzI (FlbEa/FlbD family)
MYVNEDHVERLEGGATSAVYMTNGTYLIVRDDVESINDQIRSEKLSLLSRALRGDRSGGWAPELSALPPNGPVVDESP